MWIVCITYDKTVSHFWLSCRDCTTNISSLSIEMRFHVCIRTCVCCCIIDAVFKGILSGKTRFIYSVRLLSCTLHSVACFATIAGSVSLVFNTFFLLRIAREIVSHKWDRDQQLFTDDKRNDVCELNWDPVASFVVELRGRFSFPPM